MKKKVIITIPDFSIGGAEKMVSLLASNIDFSKFEVYIVCVRKKMNNHIENSLNPNIKLIFLGKGKGFSVITFFKAYLTIAKIKPDILHTHIQSIMYFASYILTHRLNCLHTIHNIPQKESTGFRRKLINYLLKRKKITLVGISDTISAEARALYNTKRVVTIYNPVDKNLFFKYSCDGQQKSNEKFVFISVGRLHEQKNQKTLIEAFAKFSKNRNDCVLNILGDGELRKPLEKLIIENEMQEKILLLGQCSDVNRELNNSNAFVLSSIYEGLPMTILEAMSCGLPIIATNVGGVSDIVHDNGIIIENPLDVEAYCKAFEIIMNDEINKTMSEISLNESENYDIKIIAKEYEEVYLNDINF